MADRVADRLADPRAGTAGLVRHRVLVAFVVVTSLVFVPALVAACGSSSKGSADSGATDTTAEPAGFGTPVSEPGSSVTIDAIDNDFEPKNIEIHAGTKVTFTNKGRNQHDVVAVDPAKFDFGIDESKFAPGDSETFTFAKPGVYPYYCSLHATATVGDMRGQVIVK
ncbi:MAG TPA: plastocyanin/azurin family copper-binding protein [Acidimicrobiales bacterium]|nr:plastocyanin/azurin family copper-binding protein [Acidimicrobiales bacterium]